MAGQLGLHELFQQLRAIAYGIWRKRWYMLISAWVVCFVGWSLAISMPYRYTSVGTLYVNSSVIEDWINISTNKNQSRQKDLDILRNLLLQEKNLKQILMRTELSPSLTTDAQLRDAVAEMKNNIAIIPKAGNNFVIEYEADDNRLSEQARRSMARLVVSQLMNTVGERAAISGDQDLDNTLDFINSEVAKVQRRVADTETARNTFRARYIEIIDGGNLLSKLQSEREKLKAAERAKREIDSNIKNSGDLLRITDRYIYTYKDQSNQDGKSAKSRIEARLEEQQKKLDEAYAEGKLKKHPVVIALLSSIEKIKEELAVENARIEKEIEKVKKTNKENEFVRVDPNPKYEDLAFKINAMQEQKVTIEENLREFQENVKRYEQFVQDEAAIKSKYAELDRNFRAQRRELDNWTKRRRDVEVADQVKEASDVSIRVVSEASDPVAPSGPPRLLFLTGTLGGGLMIGLAVAWILSQIRPVILSVEQLREQFDLPVLGNVTVMLDEKARTKKKRELILFGALGGSLFVVFGVLIVLDSVIG